MPVINFENLKTEKPERNFDNVPLDENANIGIQNGQQIYGVKKFFLAVKDAIDWISSIAGNKNFTGEVSMGGKKLATEEAVNNALANYLPITKNIYGNTTNEIDVSDVPNGVYLVSANNLYHSANDIYLGVFIVTSSLGTLLEIKSNGGFTINYLAGKKFNTSSSRIYGLKLIKIGFN